MALTIGDNFSYQGAKPLDGRIKYDTLAAMKAMADSTLYDGCLAYCVATDKTYQWKSTNTVDADTGKWREFETGGGSTYTAGDGISISNDTISTDSSVYRSADTAETTIADDDYFPFYDTSATAKRKSLWSNIKAKLKAYFDTLYATLNGHTIENPEGTALTQRDTLQFGGDLEVSDDDENEKTVVAPHELTAAELAEIVTPLPSVPVNMPVLFDETGTERVVGWYKLANGTKKPVYEKTVTGLSKAINTDSWTNEVLTIQNGDKLIDMKAYELESGTNLLIDLTSCLSIKLIYSQTGSVNVLSIPGTKSRAVNIVTIQYTKTTDQAS